MTVGTVTDTPNVKYVTSTHNVRKFLPSTHNSISIPTQVYCPKNNNNIANSHLPLTNLLPSSETKSSVLSLSSNLCFSECTFSLSKISCPRIYHVSSSLKFSLFFMILFNAMFLHQSLRNALIFNILTDFTLFLLVCLIFYYKTCGTMTFYIKRHENIFDSFLTCNVLKITSSVPMEDFSLNFKVFILIITCLVFCLRNERFVVTVQKFCPKGSYWIKPSETLSFLVHFILFAICITFLLVKILLSTVLKSVNFIVSLFGHISKYRITITFLFLTFEHERIFENYSSVNRSFIKISYLNNPFNNDFKNFNVFLTNFTSFSDFKVFSKAPFSDALCRVEATHLTFNESQLTGFSMMQVYTERRLQTDFHFRLNVNVTVTVVSYMNSTSRETKLPNFLQQWTDLKMFSSVKPESTSKAALFETNSQIVLFFIFFFYVFLKHKRDMRLSYLLIVFIFLQIHLDLPSRQKTYLKIKVFNKIQFFNTRVHYTCDDLSSFRFNYLCKFHLIPKLKRINNKYFLRILLLLSGDISLNPGPAYNNQSLHSNEWNVFRSKGIHLIHLNVNSLLPKIDEIRYIAERTNTAVIGITESKLDESIFQSEIQIDNYDLLRCDRNRNGGGVACYIRSDISYVQKDCFSNVIENIFFEILLPKT